MGIKRHYCRRSHASSSADTSQNLPVGLPWETQVRIFAAAFPGSCEHCFSAEHMSSTQTSISCSYRRAASFATCSSPPLVLSGSGCCIVCPAPRCQVLDACSRSESPLQSSVQSSQPLHMELATSTSSGAGSVVNVSLCSWFIPSTTLCSHMLTAALVSATVRPNAGR